MTEPRGDVRLELNADRRRRFGTPGRTLALLCECGDASCHRTLLLTAEEYDARRPGPVIHPAHTERQH
jgi:hypothetical protein